MRHLQIFYSHYKLQLSLHFTVTPESRTQTFWIANFRLTLHHSRKFGFYDTILLTPPMSLKPPKRHTTRPLTALPCKELTHIPSPGFDCVCVGTTLSDTVPLHCIPQVWVTSREGFWLCERIFGTDLSVCAKPIT